MPTPPDPIFSDLRLAEVYDALDPDRGDLDEYETAVVDEFGAGSVLDIGCGTGTFALRLGARGLSVTGADPALASIEVARAKRGADSVTWVEGTVFDAPATRVDAITMTANVAQVFLEDRAWTEVLEAAHARLNPGGVLIFEARRQECRAWERWTRELSHHATEVPTIGTVERWVELTAVEGERVTFEQPTIFHTDGARVDSTSTLRFRSRAAIEDSLTRVGFRVLATRDAHYAPGRAWVYVAVRDPADPADPSDP